MGNGRNTAKDLGDSGKEGAAAFKEEICGEKAKTMNTFVLSAGSSAVRTSVIALARCSRGRDGSVRAITSNIGRRSRMVSLEIQQTYNKIALNGLSIGQVRCMLDDLAPFIESGAIRVMIKEVPNEEQAEG